MEVYGIPNDIRETRIEWETGCAFCKYINQERIIYIREQNVLGLRLDMEEFEMMSMASIIATAVCDRKTAILFRNL